MIVLPFSSPIPFFFGQSLVYVSIWSALFVLPPHEYEQKHNYEFPKDWYRVTLHVLGILLTLLLIVNELWDYCLSSKKHNRWRMWREKELQKGGRALWSKMEKNTDKIAI